MASRTLGWDGGHGAGTDPVSRDRDSRVRYSAADVARAVGLAHQPTPEQSAVIEAPLRPLLVVAGAGSGKTETMAARVVWLVANGFVQPEAVLGLTFTRKAASELGERIGARLAALRRAGLWDPPEGEGAELFGGTPTISTYHAYAGQLVRDHGMLLGREPDARLLTEAAVWQLAHEAVAGWGGDMTCVDNAESTVTASVVDLAAEMAEHLCDSRDVVNHLASTIARLEQIPRGEGGKRTHPARDTLITLRTRLAVAPIVQRFEELKAEREVLDFSDQMALAARLASDHPDVGAMERERFKVVLLDEFQDTSHAQLTLLTALFVAAGEPVPVTAVGDPNQSIYGWRGASATTLESFVSAFADPRPAAQLTLSTSWRNDRSILAAANHVAAPLRSESHVVQVPELVPRDEAASGSVSVARYESSDEEASAVAAWLASQRAQAASVTAAVLCRKRSQFLPIVRALEAAGIPHEVVGLGGLLLTPEVGDILAVLHVVHDPSRGDQLMRLLTGPRLRLGAADLDGLAARARLLSDRGGESTGVVRDISPDVANAMSVVEALEDLPDPDWVGPRGEWISDVALGRLRGLARVIRSLRGLVGVPLPELIAEVERALGLDIELLSRPQYTPAASRAHLDALADVASQYASGADRPTLGGFLAWANAAIDLERGLDKGFVEGNPDAVQVMTIHAAKGLEWDVVAVPGLVEGTFPSHTGRVSSNTGTWCMGEVKDTAWLGGLTKRGLPFPLRGDRAGLPAFRLDAATDWVSLAKEMEAFSREVGRHQLAEERRLAYVAFTRARHAILATASVWSTGSRPRVTSRFLEELVDTGSAVGCAVHGESGSSAPAGRVGQSSMPQPLNHGALVHIGPWRDMPPTVPPPTRPSGLADDGVLWPLPHPVLHGARVADAALAVRSASSRSDRAWLSASDGDTREELITVLLAEWAERRREVTAQVELPAHLSASQLVALSTDSDRFALDLRRPVPSRPDAAARRGTDFHAWVEQHYASAAMIDPDELPGFADVDAVPELDLSGLRERFLGTEWADRTPVELETAVETVIAGVAIRGRIDAVFRDRDGWIIIDWKTGVPRVDVVNGSLAVQLATYRIAWARLRGVPIERVRAGFCFVSTGETIWPDLPTEAELVHLLQGKTADQRG